MNVSDFYENHVRSELENADLGALPVLKADALRYIVSFRSQLSSTALEGAVRLAIALLLSPSPVVRVYAAHAIERLLVLKKDHVSVIGCTFESHSIMNSRLLSSPRLNLMRLCC